MRKKFTLLFVSLLAFAGVAKAGVTDLPEMSTEGDIKWYTISNTRSASGKYLYWTGSGVKDSNDRTGASFFYVTGSADACYIHNYATDLLFSGAGAWTEAGVACKLSVSSHGTGLLIGFNGTYLNEQNYDNGFTTWGDINDAGSIFVFEEVTDFSSIIDVPAAKTAAIAEINNYAVETSIYPAATDAVDAVNAVTPASNGLKDLDDAVEAINAIVVDYRDKAYQALAGKYFTIQTLTTDRSMGFMQMATSNVVGSAEAESPANIWQFVYNGNGTVNVYNPYIGKYLCEPQDNSEVVAVTTDQATAGAYVLNVNNDNPAVADAKVKLTSNGKSVHMAGGHTLVRWDNGGASEWQVVEVEDFSNIISLYKTASTATLDSWATLSVVFDAALIEAAKAAIDGIATTDWTTFAAIDAQLKNVTDKVAEKYFTFKNDDKANSARIDAYLAANTSTNKGCGTKTFDYNAIWRLLSAGGTSFYLYNELNNVYLKNPSSGDLVADAAQAATYTFEIIDAATNKAELKSAGQTLHLAGGLGLMNYDNDDAASRWYIATYDYKADLTALIAENVNNHEAIPSLGKYPTAAYEALVEAGNSATTVAEVAEAITAFEATFNIPIYFITSKHEGYAAGSAILYNGSEWRWAAANKYNKQMWMTIPGYTEENVPVVDAYDANGTSYAICDYLTGTKMRDKDVQIVKVADWEGAYNLQYNADASSTDAAQHAKDNGQLVSWKAGTKDDAQASVWDVEYIGSTYELAALTDEHVTALNNLRAAYGAKAYCIDAVIGEALGQYKGDKEAIVTVLEAGEVILEKSLVEQAALTVEAINAATAAINEVEELAINLPVEGKYYRFQGACEASLAGYYITGHTNADGGRIALTAEPDNSTIFYYADANLKAYESGKYIGLSSTHWTFANDTKPASTITFAASPRKAGTYTIKSADRYMHYTIYNGTVQVDRCESDADAQHDWYIAEVTELPVLGLALDKTEATIVEKQTLQLIATVTPDHATSKTVTWSTSDEKVATVDENGVVTAITDGQVTITATAGDKTAECAVTVTKASYTFTLNIDGVEHFIQSVQRDTELATIMESVEKPEDREGYTFSGWDIPVTMPANDLTLDATYTVNKYTVTFKIGEEVIYSEEMEYGATIVAPKVEGKEGHSFAWDKEVAKTVPAEAVTYEGAYTVNKYKVCYIINGEVVFEHELEYGAAIEIPEELETKYPGFEWIGEDPEVVYVTMPAFDIAFNGNDVTGLDCLSIDSSAVIYDLSGRRVLEAVKGFYIINGKKVLVK